MDNGSELDGYEPQVAMDDESIPLWVRIEECIRLIDLALKESKKRGRLMVEKELEYYSAKAAASYKMLQEGYANTYIQTVIKGIEGVNEAMGEYHEAEVLYKNANEAIQALKLKLRVLENELQRDWEQSKRM